MIPVMVNLASAYVPSKKGLHLKLQKSVHNRSQFLDQITGSNKNYIVDEYSDDDDDDDDDDEEYQVAFDEASPTVFENNVKQIGINEIGYREPASG